MASEEVVRIDEVEMGEAGAAHGILAKEKQKFEYIHGHVEHQELHVPPLDELSKGISDIHCDDLKHSTVLMSVYVNCARKYSKY